MTSRMGRAWDSSPGPGEPAVLSLPCSPHCFAKDQLAVTKRKEPSYAVGDLGGSDAEESACSAGGPGSIPGSGRSPGGGNGNLLQYSCLENPMDRGAWWALVHGVTELDATEQLHSLSLYTVLLQHAFKRKDTPVLFSHTELIIPHKCILPRTSKNGLTWKPGLCRQDQAKLSHTGFSWASVQ